MNPRPDFLLDLQDLARQTEKLGPEQFGTAWKKAIENQAEIPVKSLSSFLRRARLGTIKRPPWFERKLRALFPSDAVPLAAELQRQWAKPFQALDEVDLKPKERTIWRELLRRIVTLAESDPAQAAYLGKVIAGMEAELKAKARRRRPRRTR